MKKFVILFLCLIVLEPRSVKSAGKLLLDLVLRHVGRRLQIRCLPFRILPDIFVILVRLRNRLLNRLRFLLLMTYIF